MKNLPLFLALTFIVLVVLVFIKKSNQDRGIDAHQWMIANDPNGLRIMDSINLVQDRMRHNLYKPKKEKKYKPVEIEVEVEEEVSVEPAMKGFTTQEELDAFYAQQIANMRPHREWKLEYQEPLDANNLTTTQPNWPKTEYAKTTWNTSNVPTYAPSMYSDHILIYYEIRFNN